MGLENVYWIHLAGVRDQWWIAVNGAMELWMWGGIPWLTSCERFCSVHRVGVWVSDWVSEWVCVCVCLSGSVHHVNNHVTATTKVIINRPWRMSFYAGQLEANFWAGSWSTRCFKYDRDWFVCKQAALRSSSATLREWSHNLHPPSYSG